MWLESLLRGTTTRLPFYGMPILADLLARRYYTTTVRRQLTIGDITLDVDLSNAVMRNAYFGIFEKHLLALMRRVLKPGGVFVDVGANIGYLSSHARRLVGGGGSVHAFEPVPEYARYLEAAAQLSNIRNIFINHCAVGNAPGQVTISISGERNIGWNTIVPGFMAKVDAQRSLDVPMVTLTKYFEDQNIRQVDLIKIDVEGSEMLVFDGLRGFLNSGASPIIVSEISPAAATLLELPLSTLVDEMASLGYRALKFSRRGLRRIYAGGVCLERADLSLLDRTTDIVWIKNEDLRLKEWAQ